MRNHKSIRNELTVELVRLSLRIVQPKDGQWTEATYPLAGIFGGDASEKTVVAEALGFAVEVVRSSASTWHESSRIRRAPYFGRAPYLLDAAKHTSSSKHEFDFVHAGRWHAILAAKSLCLACR